MAYQLLSLFSGAGGLDIGFRAAGFDTVLAVDNCKDAVATFNTNAEKAAAIKRNLACMAPDRFLKLIPSGSNPVGLIGGPPCQGFSRGNVFKNDKDPRNLLPFRYAALLAAANERHHLHFFVFENVAGLLGPKHAPRLERIVQRLSSAGFRIFIGDLDASRYSVPQRRRRVFIVGLNCSIYPDVNYEFPQGGNNTLTVADAIKELPPPVYFDRNIKPEDITPHPNHWTMVPRSHKFVSGCMTDGRSFKKLKWDEPSPTVAYGNREVHVHPDGGRRLSVYEAMLLQGFPPSYRLMGSLSSQITQISNAVPPPMAEAIAVSLRELMTKQMSKQTRSVAPAHMPVIGD